MNDFRMTAKQLLLFAICMPTCLWGQQKNSGFYGKKGVLQIDYVMNTPMFNNILNTEATAFKSEGDVLVKQKDYVNIGYRLNAGYAFTRNFALLFEFGQEFSSAYPAAYEFIYDQTGYGYEVRHEMVDVFTYFFIPKIEVATANALLPMGLSHQIGIGLAYSIVQNKDYTYETIGYDNITGEQIITPHKYSDAYIDPISFAQIRPIQKTVIYYGLNVRTPLNKSILLSYGLKYMLQLGKASSTSLEGNVGNERYTEMIERAVARHRALSFIHVNLGLSYVF